jgi:hypothetical protein
VIVAVANNTSSISADQLLLGAPNSFAAGATGAAVVKVTVKLPFLICLLGTTTVVEAEIGILF